MAAQPRRILLGFDGSDASWRALEAAIQLTGYGSTLTVVTVVTVAPEGESSSELSLARAREHVRLRQVTAAYVQRIGDPVEELLDAARELEAELIVVGRSDDHETPSHEPGSVSASVVRSASCDVLVVN
ncbi:MAG: universal stress protein [Gaiellaceae bacterium]